MIILFLCHQNTNTLNLPKIFDKCALNIILLKEYFKTLVGDHFPAELIEILGKLLAKVLLSNINLICGDFCKVEYDKNIYMTALGSHKMELQCKKLGNISSVIEFTGSPFYSAMLTKSGNVYITEKANLKEQLESRKLMYDVVKVSFHQDYILMGNKQNELYIYSTHPVKIYGHEPFKFRDDVADVFCCEKFFGFVTSIGDVYTIFSNFSDGINNIKPLKTSLSNIVSVSSCNNHFLALDKNNILYCWGCKKGRTYNVNEKVASNVVKFTAGKNCMMYMNSRLEINVCTHCTLSGWKKVMSQ